MFQYCEMDTDSAYIALAGDSIDDLVSTDRREHNRVASRARPSINEHPACSKLSGVETGLLGCARKPTTVSVQLTSAQLKASANVTTSSTKTPS